MRALWTCAFLVMVAVDVLCQTPPPGEEPKQLLRELEDALTAGDLVKGADLATRLDAEVQRRAKASLVTDAAQRVDETLQWLPTDTESIFVLQYPVVLDSRERQPNSAARPAEYYALDRLAALDGGRLLEQLDGQTIRLTIAAMKNIRTRGQNRIVPALMPDGDAAYFFYFTAPIPADVFGAPDEKSGAYVLWMRKTQIDAGAAWVPGSRERPIREDSTWLAVPRPDLLVAASDRDLLLSLLDRISGSAPPGAQRALPPTLPEWPLVDRSANFWALRHFSELGGRHDLSNPQCTADGAVPDPLLRGLAVRFDVDNATLEARFVHSGTQPPRILTEREFGSNFKAEKGADGVWRFRSSIRERGPFPFHLAVWLLGFGGYR